MAPIDSRPELLRRPFGFHLEVDTLPSPIPIEASEALPPPLDMVLPIRAPACLHSRGNSRSLHLRDGASVTRSGTTRISQFLAVTRTCPEACWQWPGCRGPAT